MTLDEWLKAKNMTDQEFADQIDVSAQSVGNYRRGNRIPEKAVMRRIFVATDEQVTANDFYLEPITESPLASTA